MHSNCELMERKGNEQGKGREREKEREMERKGTGKGKGKLTETKRKYGVYLIFRPMHIFYN